MMKSPRARAKLAAELHREKEDLDDWEVAPSGPAQRPSVSISLRLPPDDVDLLQRRAANTGTTVSSVVRQAIHHYFDETKPAFAQFSFTSQGFFATGPVSPFTRAPRNEREGPPEHHIIQLYRIA